MKEEFKIALTGNPNCGKTTLFNNLTGMNQHVGNWPGKTIEKKEGTFKYDGSYVKVVDLPGIYSLSTYSMEEIVTRDFLLKENPDIVVQIIDSVNIERNLYLTLQLIELGVKVALILNMNNFAKRKGIIINEKKLSNLIKVPVIKLETTDHNVKPKLMDFLEKSKSNDGLVKGVKYSNEIEEHINELIDILNKNKLHKEQLENERWIAVQLILNQVKVLDSTPYRNKKEILERTKKIQKHLKRIYSEDLDTIIANERYAFISGLMKESVKKPKKEKLTKTDFIDKIVTHKIWGFPIFMLILFLMFQITFAASVPVMKLISSLFSFLSDIASELLLNFGAPQWLSSLVSNGVINGVGSIVVFLPNIAFLYLLMAFLEDSGYMARAAFIMDKLMHKIGLHGKSFIPLILGFGCNVPAIMATRTLENKKDRIVTMMIVPFMSCSGKLPLYILFVSAFFKSSQGLIIFGIYLLGILMAILSALIFKKTMLKKLSSPFVMELPHYRLPTIKGLLIHMWEKTKLFLTKAGTVIFVVVLLIWFLGSIPFGVQYGSEASIIGKIGAFVSPIFAPLGFGNAKATISLIFGVVAKEVIVSTMATLYGATKSGLEVALQSTFTHLSALSFMVFSLLYIPCIATLATIKRETNSWRWMAFSATYFFIVAWIVSFIVYRIGLLMGFI